MLQKRIIPCLQLSDESLVKTTKFNNPHYIGDPVNTVRIFNELEVDELVLVDINASRYGREPNFEILRGLADECFMPVSYGGGIRSLDQAKRIFELGIEKIIVNSSFFSNPGLLSEIANIYGSQAVILAIDSKKNIWGQYETYSKSATHNEKRNPFKVAKEAEQLGAGEILITAIDREGTWRGFDLELTRQISEATSLPVIAHGGAGSIVDIESAIKVGKASAAALGSMVVFQAKGLGVLVNFPDKNQITQILS